MVRVTKNNLLSRLTRQIRRFGGDRRGNIAITFALATLPLVGFVGAAVDFSHAHSVRTALQSALDSTALMLAKDASTLSNNDLNSKALAYFKALFTRPEGTNISISASYNATGGSAVVVKGQADVPTIFMEALGKDTITVTGSSTTRWGTSRMRVALALDVTGSMSSDGKMDALKSAAKSLLTQLQAAASKDGDIYVSIIPFNKDVNIGKSNYAADYIDWSDWDDENGEWEETKSCKKSGRSRRGRSRCDSDREWVAKDHDKWNGCITDRGLDAPGSSEGYDQKVTLPDPNIPDTLFPAEQFNSCPVEMMGLNYNWTSMTSLIDKLKPVGNTNQPIGLVWAWQSLVGGGPLTVPPKESGLKYQDIIILMSDGLNTEDRWYSRQSSIDKRMYNEDNSGKGTCANIKATGVTIYTMHVNTDRDPVSTLLKNCASSSEKFFLVTKASDISAAFTAIGTDLTKLRVAE